MPNLYHLITLLKFWGAVLLGAWVLIILFWLGVYLLAGGGKR